VSIDLPSCASALNTFTAEAASYKIKEFAKTKPDNWTDEKSAMEKLIKEMGYDEFLNANMKALGKVWSPPPPPSKEPAAAAPAAKAPPAAKKAPPAKKE